MQTDHGGLFGRIAVHLKFITPDQLRLAIEIHGRYGNTKRLGDILVEQGWIDQAKVEQVLTVQRTHEAKLRAKESTTPTAAAAPGGPVAVPESRATLGKLALEKMAVPAPQAEAEGPTAVVKNMDRFLIAAARYGASDLHLHVGHPVLMRLNGRLTTGNTPVYLAEDSERDLFEILTPQQRELFLEHGDLSFAYEIPGALRARAAYCRQQRGGVDAVFRLIPLEVPTLDALGLPRDIARFATFHQGMVLFTGPTGCGKSTTLAGLLNMINNERQEHIITVEDPIEFVYPSKMCLVRQRQVIEHTSSYERALRAALREDPDIIVVGELRDRETISLAITAAETGHLVFGTLHTNNAVRTINRILDAFPPEEAPQIRSMVSESLRGIISQKLVPTADGKRRVPALEILSVTPPVSSLIREAKAYQIPNIMQVGRKSGMRLLDDSLAKYVEQRVITKEEARRHAENPEEFK
jgi:twitching motility protein PilT